MDYYTLLYSEDKTHLLNTECASPDCGHMTYLPRAFDQYGAIFLHSDRNWYVGADVNYREIDGYIGFTCPECRKTTLKKYMKPDFDWIKAFAMLRGEKDYRFGSPRMRYQSAPYNWNADLYYTLGSYDEQNDRPHISFKDVFSIYGETDAGSTDISIRYCPYELNDVAFTSLISFCLYSEETIQQLLLQENKENIKKFPRYFLYDPWIKKLDRLLFKFRDQIGILSETSLFGFPIVRNVVSENKKRIYWNLEYLNILEASANLVSINKSDDGRADYALFRNTQEFIDNVGSNFMTISLPEEDGGVAPANTFSDGDDNSGSIVGSVGSLGTEVADVMKHIQGDRRPMDYVRHMWDSFPERSIQRYLAENLTQFLEQYENALRSNFYTLKDYWKIKKNHLIQLINFIEKERLSSARYAFFKEGSGWTIVFDGRRISGLRGKGFIYLQHLVRHPFTDVAVEDLLFLEGENVSIYADQNQFGTELSELASYEGMAIGSHRVGENLGRKYEDEYIFADHKRSTRIVSNDEIPESIKMIQHKMESLKKEIKEASQRGDQEKVEQLNVEYNFYRNYLAKDNQHFRSSNAMSSGKVDNQEVKRKKDSVGRNIIRAIDRLEEQDEQAYEHFKRSVKEPYSPNPSYSPEKDILWMVI